MYIYVRMEYKLMYAYRVYRELVVLRSFDFHLIRMCWIARDRKLCVFRRIGGVWGYLGFFLVPQFRVQGDGRYILVNFPCKFFAYLCRLVTSLFEAAYVIFLIQYASLRLIYSCIKMGHFSGLPFVTINIKNLKVKIV